MDLFTLFGKISLDTSGVQKGEQQAKKSIEQMKSDVMKLAAEYRKQGDSASEAMKKAWANIDKSQYESSETAKKSAGSFSDAWSSASSVLSGVGGAIVSATSTIASAMSNVATGIGNAAELVTNTVGGAMQMLDNGIYKVCEKAVEGLKQVAEFSYDVGSEFEAQMSKVNSIRLDATAEEMDKIAQKSKQLGSTTKFTATEAGQGFEYMAMAGWSVGEMLEGIDPLLNLATASGTDLAKTSDIVTDAMTAFGLKANETARFTDVLASASSNSNTNVSMLGESFKYVGATAGAMGFTIEDTAQSLGVLANSGIKASSAGTQLRKAMTVLAGGVTLSSDALGDYNLTAAKADGTMKSWAEVVDELRWAFSHMTEEEATANAKAIGGLTAQSAILTLANATADSYNALGEAINNSAGATQQMSDVMIDNVQGALTILKSSADGFGLAVYDYMQTPLKEFLQFTSNELSTLTNQLSKGGFTGLAEAVGGSITRFAIEINQKLPTIINSASDIIPEFIKSIKSNLYQISNVAEEVGKSLLNGFTNIYPKIQNLALSVLKSGANIIANNSDLIVNSFVGLMNDIYSNFENAGDVLYNVGDKILDSISKGIMNNGGSLINGFVKIMGGIGTSIVKLTNKYAPTLIKAVRLVMKQVSSFIASNSNELSHSAVILIKTITDTLVANAGSFTKSAGTFLEYIKSGIQKNLPILVDSAFDIINMLLDNVLNHNNIVGFLDFGVDVIDTIGKGIVNNFDKLSATAVDLVATLGEYIFDNLPTIVTVAEELTLKLANGLTSNNSVRELVKSAVECVGKLAVTLTKPDQVKRMWNAGIRLIVEVGKGLIDAIPGLLVNVVEVIDNVVRQFGERMGDFNEIGKNMVEGIRQGIENNVGFVFDAARMLAQGIKNVLQFELDEHSPSRWGRDFLGKNLILGIKQGIEGNMGMIETALSGITDNMVIEPDFKLSMDKIDGVISNIPKANIETPTTTIENIKQNNNKLGFGSYNNKGSVPINVYMYPNSQTYTQVILNATEIANAMSGGGY